MKFNFFSKRTNKSIQKEWNTKGKKYAADVNEMIEFVEKNGWENFKGKGPIDDRAHLAEQIIDLLRKANSENKIEKFRLNYPPAHAPIIKYIQERGQGIDQIHFIENEKILFQMLSTGKTYILDKSEVIQLDDTIQKIGKSKKGNIFAVQIGDKITTTKGWQGETIETFEIKKEHNIKHLIPFNDGLKVLTISEKGIYLISKTQEIMIHPVQDLEDEEWIPYIDMENATLSNDNKYIVVGDQDSDHRILDSMGNQIGAIGPQSSYAHFCLFSNDDNHLITNSCHFYNGVTISVQTNNLHGLEVEAYTENDLYNTIDDEMRVYCGIAYDDLYILGEAYGYIKAIDKNGKLIWRHFIGSTICSLAISDNKEILWVGSYSGMIHQLRLGKGHRDDHTIGNGKHYEDLRVIAWKSEPIMKW